MKLDCSSASDRHDFCSGQASRMPQIVTQNTFRHEVLDMADPLIARALKLLEGQA
jgi:hypothetical protein